MILNIVLLASNIYLLSKSLAYAAQTIELNAAGAVNNDYIRRTEPLKTGCSEATNNVGREAFILGAQADNAASSPMDDTKLHSPSGMFYIYLYITWANTLQITP
jgi:hypothetical protein